MLVVVVVVSATPTPTTIVMVIKRYWYNLIYDKNSIVGPIKSIQLTTVVDTTTSSPATKIAPSALIKWADDKRMHHVGVGSSLPELLGGLRVK